MKPRLAFASLVIALVAIASPDFVALGVQPFDPPKRAPAFALPDLDALAAGQDSVTVLWAVSLCSSTRRRICRAIRARAKCKWSR